MTKHYQIAELDLEIEELTEELYDLEQEELDCHGDDVYTISGRTSYARLAARVERQLRAAEERRAELLAGYEVVE